MVSFESADHNHIIRWWVFLGVGIVLLWRLMAFIWPSSFIIIPGSLRAPMAFLGVLFLACGVYSWRVRPSRWTMVFLLYGVGGGIHWGGSIGLSSAALEQSLLFVYLAFSALAEAALLHLSLIYQRGTTVRERWWAEHYLPPIFALIIAPMVSIVPKTSLQALAGIILLLANLFSIIAAIVFVVRLFMVDATVRRASHLALVVGVGVSSGVVALLGSEGMLPGNPEAWNLILGVLPVTIAVALVTNELESIDSQSGNSD